MGWTLVDFPVLRLSAPVDPSTFQTTISCGQVPQGSLWRVERITAWAPGETFDVVIFDQPVGPNSIAADFGNMGQVGNILQAARVPGLIGTSVCIFDEASPITIKGGDELTLVFLAPLATPVPVQARIQYQLLRGNPATPQPIVGAVPPQIPTGI